MRIIILAVLVVIILAFIIGAVVGYVLAPAPETPSTTRYPYVSTPAPSYIQEAIENFVNPTIQVDRSLVKPFFRDTAGEAFCIELMHIVNEGRRRGVKDRQYIDEWTRIWREGGTGPMFAFNSVEAQMAGMCGFIW